MAGVSAPPASMYSSETSHRRLSSLPTSQSPRPLLPPVPKTLNPRGLSSHRRCRGSGLLCRSSSATPGPPGPGENESKAVLDAFFLGKAFVEALNERVGSTVGEVLSVIGQWQAEQQKQVLDFQEEVLERAKKAKEKAAIEAMEAQGLISKTTSSPDPAISTYVSPTSPTPTKDDPLQEMLKD